MARRRRGRGIGTLFVVLGLVAVLGGTFAAGFFAGRHWARVQVMTGLARPQAGKEPERHALAGRPAEGPPVPPLTFYQELTAPLTSPPPRPAAKPEPPRPARAEPVAKPAPPPKAEPNMEAKIEPGAEPLSESKPDSRSEARTEPRAPDPAPPAPARADTPASRPERVSGYTVQVAAYATRAQAEGLVSRLGTLGFPGDVSETTTPGGIRYRVRVGTYGTKEAAREAATRLGAATGLGGFVAPR